MKGLILAAGQGTRLSELNLKHKSFAEVNKKHIIDYSLDLLSERVEGVPICSEIVVVVGYHAEAIKEYIGSTYRDVPVKYAYQSERKGIAHAVKTARELLDDDFIMCLADEILFNPRLRKMVEAFYQHQADCACGVVIEGEDFSMKPIAYSVDGDGVVHGVTEKPNKYENDIRGIGECIFSRSCLDYLDELKPNPIRGEFEMGDWIRLIIEDGKRVEVFELADGYCNINSVKDIQDAEKLIAK